MLRVLHFIVREIIYVGHLQAIGAAVVVHLSSMFLGLTVELPLFIATYCVFQAIYYFDRYRDLDKDGATNKHRTEHLKTYSKHIPIIISALLLLALISLVLYGTKAALIFLGAVSVMGFLYPLFFKQLTSRFPFFKNFYVASVFAVLIFLPNLYLQQQVELSATALVLFGFVFAESLVTQFVLDIKDIASDVKQGLRTLLSDVGEKAATSYIIILNLLIAVTITILASRLGITPKLISLALGTLAFNMFVMFLVAKQKKSGFVWASAKYIFWGILLIVL